MRNGFPPDPVLRPIRPGSPYVKGPDGLVYLVNPFTGPEPWKRVEAPEPEFPSAIINLLGFPPAPGDKLRRLDYEQTARSVERIGLPDGASEADARRANDIYEAWDMGRAKWYESTFGPRAVFTDQPMYLWDVNGLTAIETPHLIVATYQMQAITRGVLVPRIRHPFVSPELFAGLPGHDE